MIFEHEPSKIKIADVVFDKSNPNVMNQEQMAGLRKAMERFGYLSPIVIDQNNMIADGEHRVLIYKEFGLEEIPCYRVTFSDDKERRLLRQTMNKLKGQHDFIKDAEEMAIIYQSDALADLSGLIGKQEQDLKEFMLRYRTELPFNHEQDEQLDQIIDDQLRKDVPDTKLGEIIQLGNHRIICADCTDKRSTDKLLQDFPVDLTITSPPYDELREYGGNNFDFEDFKTVAANLYQWTKEGGMAVWVVGDSTIDGSETLTSFKQAIHFREIGFKVHDTMIYAKTGFNKPSSNRYHQTFEYMFVLLKGSQEVWNPLLDRPNSSGVGRKTQHTMRMTDGSLVKSGNPDRTLSPYGMRFNIWMYNTGYAHTAEDKIAFQHPAIFPLPLAKDHVESWSNPNARVFDPFLGSGTTLIACEQLNRTCYGVEIDPHYCDVVVKRWENLTNKKAVRLPL